MVDIWDGIKCIFMLMKLNNLKINKNWWTDVYKDHWHAKPTWMNVLKKPCEDPSEGFELNVFQTPSMHACVTTTCCSIVVDLVLLKNPDFYVVHEEQEKHTLVSRWCGKCLPYQKLTNSP